MGWGHYLVTTKNIAYASIDGRGTGFQSDEHLFKIYRCQKITFIDNLLLLRTRKQFRQKAWRSLCLQNS
jgi:hypothetical protein